MAHTLETKHDVDAFVAAVKQSNMTMGDVAAGVVVGTPLEVQPSPVDTDASVEVAPIAWQMVDDIITRASTDPLHPAYLVASSVAVDGAKRLLRARYLQGLAKYGTPLRTHNGRNAIADALQEACDGILYMAQAHAESLTVRHYDTALMRALDHTVAALINLAAVADGDVAGALLGRRVLKVPREAITVPEQEEADVAGLVVVDEVDHEARRKAEAAIEEDGSEVRR